MGSVIMDIDPEENMEAQNTTKDPMDLLSDVCKTEEEVSGVNATALVGSCVGKVIPGVKKALVGKVASYDHESRLYSVAYEDGTREDLDSFLLSKILVAEDDSTNSNLKLSCKKRKLELLVSSGSTEPNTSPGKRSMNNVPDASGGSGTSSERLDSELSEDANSSNNSPDYMQASCSVASAECHILDLPPSSGDIAIPEESISYLFSVYGFLRSFSVQLYLSPFGMDDFVGSLNCMVQNSLLDAIHLQLLRALRRHIQVLSSEGFELASRCLRHYDWSLLDALTWPAFVTEYLYLMGYMRSLEGKGYVTILSDGEYYRLPVTAKLKILQILCDDVIDSAEIRTELEMREDLEDDEEDNLDLSHPLDSGPWHVRSRSSRISAKVPAAQATTLKVTESEADTSTGNIDGNSDECRLCGMDGTLICCDGCPSAYHSRCIGLSKACLPAGQWFCPECVVDKNCPASIKVGRGIKGAEYFGTDVCGRVFLASCDYLLVIGAVSDADPFCRYYKKTDINKVLTLMSSVTENASSYAHICDGISKFWESPANSLESGQAKPMEGNNGCTDRESSSDMEARSHTSVLNSITQSRFPDMQEPNTTKQNAAVRKTGLTSLETLSYLNGTHRLTTPDISSCISTNESLTCRGDSSTSHVFNKSYAVGLSDGSRYGVQIRNEKTRNGRTSFNPQVYGNQYIHGDVAASAAANLAVLSTEEKRFSEAHVSSNSRKTLGAIVSLQMKAFSEATMYFLWPSFERKLLDVPRERCGWCIACKGSITNKKGCFLNLAAANALKGSARNNTGLRPTKHCETHFPTIAAYVANMEETLHGLIGRPLLDADYNLQWRRKIQEASSCRVLKILLLELEQSIRSIAFSGTWFKLLNDGLLKFPATTICTSLNGPSQKRGPGRRSKKQLASEAALASSESSWKDVQWWRGGKLSKVVLQAETLPSSLVKKAARQGGFKKIPDICYSESLELPRRSRQFAWRAAVQMCKNISQLALQVRYLDAHIRWKDLVPPEQANLDGKGLDGDASAFRNVVICDKRSIENKIIYALIFSSQKHIPLRVMKNVLEKESIDSENSKFWFSENHVPLYLIKDYEERIHEKLLSGSVALGLHARPKFQEKQLKFRRRDVFYYLSHKGDKPSNSSCASCKGDVNLRDASTCTICQGKCHKDCAIPLIDRTGSSLAFNITCRICYHDKTAALNASRMEIRNTHLSKGIQDQSLSHKKIMLPMMALNTIGSTGKVVVQGKNILVPSTKKEGKSKRATTSTYGLIWKRKNANDNGGQDFRLVNIVLRKTEGIDSSRKPTCCLCNAPYRSDLMYIRCEKCLNWYHADALELEEAQIFDLVGFKCCRCRRKASPKCPYGNPDYRKPEPNFVKNRNRLEGTMPDNSTVAHRPIAASSVAKEGLAVINGDLLLPSSGIVEQMQTMEAAVHLSAPKPEHNSQQKLTCRRPHTTATTDLCSVSQSPARNNIPCEIDGYTFSVTNDEIFANPSEMVTSYDYQDSASCGAVSFNDINCGAVSFNDSNCGDQWNDQMYEDVEDYEPQTYFSFTELLASENDQADVSDDPANARGTGCLSGCGEIGSYEELTYDELGPQGVYLTEEDVENKGSAVHNLSCNICKLDEPPADLLCEVCGQLIHSHCSPWVEDEEPSSGANWRCGRCRDWR